MTDAIHSATAARAAVSGAIKKAAETTGVGFDYLYRVAMRESSLNPDAAAKTSSAAGLFQFIEQTWLAAVKQYGGAHGLGAEAASIEKDANGRLTVADPSKRREILDLRFNPEKAATLAGELARENKAALEATLGRAVDGAELYAAHFLGAGGAKKLLSADPGASAAKLLPAAAKANAHVFYDQGRERTVGEVVDSFRRTIGAAREMIAEVGADVQKAIAPFLRDGLATLVGGSVEQASIERSSFAPESASFALEKKSLSPFLIAVLQALDPREIGEGRTKRDEITRKP